MELEFTINSKDNQLRAEITIRDDAEAYWNLKEQRDEIDAEFDHQVVWNDPEETRAGKERSKILVTKSGDVTNEDMWDDYLDWMIKYGERFHEVFYDRLQRL